MMRQLDLFETELERGTLHISRRVWAKSVRPGSRRPHWFVPQSQLRNQRRACTYYSAFVIRLANR